MELMTKKEAAAFLKVAARTIDYYIERGKLTAFRPNGDASGPVRLSAEEVRNFFRPAASDCVRASNDDPEEATP